ncbi:MAG TPA: carboxypeptidase-like regulatory domain-containing protein [Ktedonobacteraceae bacterium]
MNKITFPLKPGMQGPAVADLQDALQLCLERGPILANDEGTRRELSAALKRERVEQIYGDATGKLVSIFQTERNQQPSGEVDEPTAIALNALLMEWGLLDQPTEPPTPRSFVVSGQVRREDGLLLQGVRVRAVHEAAAGSLRLGEDTTDAEGRYTIRYELLPGWIASICVSRSSMLMASHCTIPTSSAGRGRWRSWTSRYLPSSSQYSASTVWCAASTVSHWMERLYKLSTAICVAKNCWAIH